MRVAYLFLSPRDTRTSREAVANRCCPLMLPEQSAAVSRAIDARCPVFLHQPSSHCKLLVRSAHCHVAATRSSHLLTVHTLECRKPMLHSCLRIALIEPCDIPQSVARALLVQESEAFTHQLTIVRTVHTLDTECLDVGCFPCTNKLPLYSGEGTALEIPSERMPAESQFDILSKDTDTPMVRRAVASNVGNFAGVVESPLLLSDVVPVFEALAADDQDNVRLLAVEQAGKVAKALVDQVNTLILCSARCSRCEISPISPTSHSTANYKTTTNVTHYFFRKASFAYQSMACSPHFGQCWYACTTYQFLTSMCSRSVALTGGDVTDKMSCSCSGEKLGTSAFTVLLCRATTVLSLVVSVEHMHIPLQLVVHGSIRCLRRLSVWEQTSTSRVPPSI